MQTNTCCSDKHKKPEYYSHRVLIKSEDRKDLINTKATNFQIRFSEPLCGKYEVKWVTIPNTIYNISTNNNLLNANGTPLTLTPGIYDGSLLAAELETQLDTLGGPAVPYTVGFNPLTLKLSVTSADASSTTFLGTGTANKSIGLPSQDTTISSGGVMPNVGFLGFPLSLGIKISQSSSCGYVTGGGQYQSTTETVPVSDGGLAVGRGALGISTATQVFVSNEKQATMIVPLLVDANFYNWTSFEDFKQTVTIEKGTRVLDLQVVDSRTGQEVDLNGGAWEMLLSRKESDVTKSKHKRMRTSSGYRNM